jgi:DNA-directed RNA polymerase subunit RPC12/RpoP
MSEQPPAPPTPPTPPNQEQQTEAPVATQNKRFPCRNCGAEMQFDPSAAAIACPYCGHENPIPQSEQDIQELDFHAYLDQISEHEETEQTQAVQCSACGAETTLDPNTAADACPFCGGALISEAHTVSKIRPKSLLPFAIDRDQAMEAFRGWVKSRWFAPNKLKQYARTDSSRLSGMYVPYWTYDSKTTSWYTGQRGDHYYVTESYTTTENGKTVRKTRQVRKTRWTSVSGVVWRNFDDILVLASRSLPKKYADRLEPWDLGNLVGYDDQYLSGFRAETYQVDLAEGFDEAKGIMATQIRSDVRHDIGGDEQRIHSVRTQHDDVTFKHLLLPVWISAYRFGDEVYRFLVNARTGEVQGERPWSWVKIALAVAAVLAVVATIAYFVTRQ